MAKTRRFENWCFGHLNSFWISSFEFRILAVVLCIAALASADEPISPLWVKTLSAKVRPSIVVITFAGREGSQQGLVTGTREIDGRTMLQLAIPVEPGNSGGPVLDMNGRVLGVVTMKSAVTQNLGFAVVASSLKTLRDKPNPAPIDRWLTIGAIDRT